MENSDKYSAQKKYHAKNRQTLTLSFMKSTEQDLLDYLDTVPNKAGYIKGLIREDIKNSLGDSKMCKKIDTDAIRKSAESWAELIDAVLDKATLASEITIDSELLTEVIEHSYSEGYYRAQLDVFAERKQEALELGIDVGKPLGHLEDPYPYSKNK